MADEGIAVVIPCYNAAATLAETLASVAAQTEPPAEVVVVDDGSTDASADAARAAGVRCLVQANAGPAAARNHGVRATQAPWLAFLDADDLFEPDKLARQREHLRASGAVLSCCDARVLVGGTLGGRKSEAVPAELTFDELLQRNPIICSTVVVRRDVVLEAGGFDEDRVLVATEDYDLWLRIVRLGRVAYLDEPLLRYRVHGGNLSDDRRFLPGIDRIMAKLRAAVPPSADLERRIAQRRAGIRVAAAYHRARAGDGREARRLLQEARTLVGWSMPQFRVWLRSLLP